MSDLLRRSLDRIAAATATLLDVPLVLISVFEGTEELVVGSHGLAENRVNAPSPLCREIATAGRPLLVQDARRRLPAGARDGWGFEIIAYAGVPLNLTDSSCVGALAALTPLRRGWQDQDLHVLRALADAAAAVLDMRAGSVAS